jgi:hypothetical protein
VLTLHLQRLESCSKSGAERQERRVNLHSGHISIRDPIARLKPAGSQHMCHDSCPRASTTIKRTSMIIDGDRVGDSRFNKVGFWNVSSVSRLKVRQESVAR